MPMSKEEEAFHVEEYKSLREEIIGKIKDIRDLNRWGLLGLAAVYSYIFSNLDKRWLFWVPVGLSLMIVELVREEHRMVAKAARYIREYIENEIATEREVSGDHEKANLKVRGGWEWFLALRGHKVSLWDQTLDLLGLWRWEPMPLWIGVFLFTLGIAICAFWFGFFPAPPSTK
jgi:hypothetical protein